MRPTDSRIFFGKIAIRGAASTGIVLIAMVFLLLSAAHSAFAQTETILDNFQSDAVGNSPTESVVFDSAGNLYGVTSYGAAGGSGAIFEMSPTEGGTWGAPVVLLDSAGRPESPLVFHGGNIFTTAIFLAFHGGVYELSPEGSGWTQDILYEFSRAPVDTSEPWGNVVFDSSGNLYGTTQLGPTGRQLGAVFELSPTESGSWTETIPFTAGVAAYGYLPHWVIMDPAGNLYVASLYGSAYQNGAVVKLTPSAGGWTTTLLSTFPSSPTYMTLGANGDIYGVTPYGGVYALGSVFRLRKTATGPWRLQTVHSFGSGTDGVLPNSAPIFDSAGNLYGTTDNGGTAGVGVVFKLSPGQGGNWSESILHNFLDDGIDGTDPMGGVVFGPDGNLYGTTYYGGLFGDGVLYELTLK